MLGLIGIPRHTPLGFLSSQGAEEPQVWATQDAAYPSTSGVDASTVMKQGGTIAHDPMLVKPGNQEETEK
jgi:hypothetical protein